MTATSRRRAPQCLATVIRKIEPMGAGMVRMYFAVEQGGTWDDRAVIEMPCSVVHQNFAFAVDAVRAIAADPDANPEPTKLGLPYLGTVN
ncbi:hypothetical protein H8A99_13395 [Bradyrhizobium sp. Arg68]|uniref:hypothetical protein n=1 Tax=Bradyrhizobium ivorense TaxID=2511166 RepID=UPI001E5AD65D|nr:hypothetical protein [Bradyrhizobium ivorense]MCC8937440.1 hypothetical protein [Bradyrhizobium ivorense]